MYTFFAIFIFEVSLQSRNRDIYVKLFVIVLYQSIVYRLQYWYSIFIIVMAHLTWPHDSKTYRNSIGINRELDNPTNGIYLLLSKIVLHLFSCAGKGIGKSFCKCALEYETRHKINDKKDRIWLRICSVRQMRGRTKLTTAYKATT